MLYMEVSLLCPHWKNSRMHTVNSYSSDGTLHDLVVMHSLVIPYGYADMQHENHINEQFGNGCK